MDNSINGDNMLNYFLKPKKAVTDRQYYSAKRWKIIAKSYGNLNYFYTPQIHDNVFFLLDDYWVLGTIIDFDDSDNLTIKRCNHPLNYLKFKHYLDTKVYDEYYPSDRKYVHDISFKSLVATFEVEFNLLLEWFFNNLYINVDKNAIKLIRVQNWPAYPGKQMFCLVKDEKEDFFIWKPCYYLYTKTVNKTTDDSQVGNIYSYVAVQKDDTQIENPTRLDFIKKLIKKNNKKIMMWDEYNNGHPNRAVEIEKINNDNTTVKARAVDTSTGEFTDEIDSIEIEKLYKIKRDSNVFENKKSEFQNQYDTNISNLAAQRYGAPEKIRDDLFKRYDLDFKRKMDVLNKEQYINGIYIYDREYIFSNEDDNYNQVAEGYLKISFDEKSAISVSDDTFEYFSESYLNKYNINSIEFKKLVIMRQANEDIINRKISDNLVDEIRRKLKLKEMQEDIEEEEKKQEEDEEKNRYFVSVEKLINILGTQSNLRKILENYISEIPRNIESENIEPSKSDILTKKKLNEYIHGYTKALPTYIPITKKPS